MQRDIKRCYSVEHPKGPGWTGLETTWSGRRCPCPMAGGGITWPLRSLSIQTMLRFYDSMISQHPSISQDPNKPFMSGCGKEISHTNGVSTHCSWCLSQVFGKIFCISCVLASGTASHTTLEKLFPGHWGTRGARWHGCGHVRDLWQDVGWPPVFQFLG